jgi:signal transduction histidine kinase
MSTSDPGTDFMSRGFQGYTRAEMTATTALTSREDPRWRWVLPVTRTTRNYITAQIPALQLSYAMAVALIYAAAQIEGALSPSLMAWWLTEAAATLGVRSLIYRWLSRASPVEIASRPPLRMLPLFAIGLAAVHWSWTATVFIGPGLNPTTVVVLLAFIMLSVACLGVAPVSPVICILYLVPIWSVTAYQLLHATWVNAGTLVILGAALTAALWAAYHIVVSGVRRYLIQSDEVELLMAELRDRNAEVERMRSVAATDLAQRSAFFASASHDFRQRVHAMKLLAQSGLDDSVLLRPLRSPMTRLADVIDELDAYMTDVLEFVRLDSTFPHPRRSTVRIQELFQRIDLQFEDIAASRNVKLQIRATPLIEQTDPAMLLRILENLISNAIKFARSRVLLNARRRGSEVHIEVRDNGRGISPESIDKVFEAFYQEQDTIEVDRQGFGLGLAIVKRLTDELGYRVQVVSRPGHGTLMRLVVPHPI